MNYWNSLKEDLDFELIFSFLKKVVYPKLAASRFDPFLTALVLQLF